MMETKQQSLSVTKAAGITSITLNRPEKRNALNGDLITQLSQTLAQLAVDPDTTVLIMNGSGDHFCAGADIEWMQNVIASQSYDANYDDAQSLADMLYQLYHFPKPTIILPHGSTLGGGMGLVAACDIAIAAENAIFGLPEVKIGLAPSTVSPYVIAAIGERAAHYYFLTGERFNADIAMRLGFVHRLSPQDALFSVGMTLAQELLKNGPKAMHFAKQLIRAVAAEKITEALAQKTAQHLTEVRLGVEAKEGLQSFLNKKSPSWIK